MVVETFCRGAGFSSDLVMETAMKAFWIVPLFAGAMLAAAPIMAQDIMAQDNVGTAPAGNRGPTGAADSEAAANQPFMATGVDLKGPPRQFPAGQTPE
jgi:hypothetical protein